ncbi:MAG: DUF262 domain-containing protein [Chitinophagaceae bacterium]
MNIGQYSLIDFIGMLDRKEIVINRDYQREPGLWPISARSYFIDTILQGYPFPKIYLYQSFNERTKRPFKELVDGQQRITTINDFYNNKFALNNASKNFSRLKYSDLDEDTQRRFLSYQIDISTILSANRSELLEMFRRMNSYTAPLKEAEKRHSTYQGDFKWFIAEMADCFSPILEDYEILTQKQIARMADAEFISELVVVIEDGIQSKRTAKIERLYKVYDTEFPVKENIQLILERFFNVLTKDLVEIKGTFITKSYVIHSLFCALTAIWFGYPNSEDVFDELPDPDFEIDFDVALSNLLALADAHEEQDEDGTFAEYVVACLSSTTQQEQRKIRTRFLIKALLDDF